MYQFYSELTQDEHDAHPTTEKNPESSPSLCEIEIADDHVVIGLAQERYGTVLPLIWELPEIVGLVCFDPQTAKVHEPRRGRPQRRTRTCRG